MFGADSIIAMLSNLRHRSRMIGWYRHYSAKGRAWSSNLINEFLFSTVDEVRSRRANKLAKAILDLQLLGETMFFRESVLRREAGGDIAYPGQRDHTAHTVNNWLLGWLIYEKSETFREAFTKAANARRLMECRGPTPVPVDIVFGDVWIYASLLHDIGYLFEGAIEPMSWRTDHELAQQGIAVVRDILENQIWSEWGLSSLRDQRTARSAVSTWFSDRPREDTLVAIIEELKSLGDLRELFREIDPPSQIARQVDGEHMDAFDLWRLHYSQFGPKSMLRHVSNVRDTLYALAIDGIPNNGSRLIDHGVAGGLIILQMNTLFFATLRALKDLSTSGDPRLADWKEGEQWRTFRAEGHKASLFTDFWWRGIVWASFATAFHNVQQLQQSSESIPKTGRFRRVDLKPLRLEDDPLSYLGILVDILQEWDRYYVVRKGHVLGKIPLQGVEVSAKITGDKLRLGLGPRSEAVRDSLSATLKDWNAIVSIVS